MGAQIRDCVLCQKCPNNPDALEHTVKLVATNADVDACAVCLAAISLRLALEMPDLYVCLSGSSGASQQMVLRHV